MAFKDTSASQVATRDRLIGVAAKAKRATNEELSEELNEEFKKHGMAIHQPVDLMPLPGLPLPPNVNVKEIMRSISQNGAKVPILLIGSRMLSDNYFSQRQIALLDSIFKQMKFSEVITRKGQLIGASRHGRAPAQQINGLRGTLWDNVVQDRGDEICGVPGHVPMRMLVFSDEVEKLIVHGEVQLGVTHEIQLEDTSPSERALAKTEVTAIQIGTPGMTALPNGQHEPQWEGIESLPDVALVFGGGPRAARLATERAEEWCRPCRAYVKSNHTKPVPREALTKENYPFKSGALFVFAAGGMATTQILQSGDAMSFKPEAVPESTFAALIDKGTLEFFNAKTDKAEVENNETKEKIQNYAAQVVEALALLVAESARKSMKELRSKAHARSGILLASLLLLSLYQLM